MTPPPAAPAQHGQDEEEKDKAEPDQRADGEAAVAFALFAHLLGHLGRFFRRQFELFDDLVCTPANPAGIVAIAEIWLHPFDIFESKPVGDDALQAVADLDAHFLLVRSDDQNDAVITLRIAQRPFPAKAIAIVGNVVTLEIGDRRDHELTLVALLERVQLFGQSGFGCVIDDVRSVHHRRSAAFGKGLGSGGQGKAERRRHGQDY